MPKKEKTGAKNTVDGSEILHQVRERYFIPIIYKVLAPSQVVLAGFLSSANGSTMRPVTLLKFYSTRPWYLPTYDHCYPNNKIISAMIQWSPPSLPIPDKTGDTPKKEADQNSSAKKIATTRLHEFGQLVTKAAHWQGEVIGKLQGIAQPLAQFFHTLGARNLRKF